MINYYCPDFVVGRKFYELFLKYQKDFPEMFYPNTKIKAVFGNFPNCIWNGGGTFFGDLIHEISEIKYYLDFFADNNILIQFTMTNPLISEIDCYDRYGNFLLNLIEECYLKQAEVLVSSEVLENYIRKYYPNITMSRSVVNTKEDYDFKAALKKFNNIVLPVRYMNNFKFLSQFNQEEKNHIEILGSDRCASNCPRLCTHYEEFAKASLYMGSAFPTYNSNILCTNDYSNDIINSSHNQNRFLISYETFIKDYVPKGFFNCKLTGRGNLYILMSNIIPYMVKPEYQLGLFKNILLNLGV